MNAQNDKTISNGSINADSSCVFLGMHPQIGIHNQTERKREDKQSFCNCSLKMAKCKTALEPVHLQQNNVCLHGWMGDVFTNF
jgi:hypothetical protein